MTLSRLNIIFIMADDHASKAISAYGAGLNHTPNIDRLATEGMKFNHCYVTNSICTPSRAAILTGTHNHVNGVMTLDSKINQHLPNVAKHLRTGGYQTARVGKWNLGEGPDHEPSGVYNDKRYGDVVRRMRLILERKMAEAGDEPVHRSNTLEDSFLVNPTLRIEVP